MDINYFSSRNTGNIEFFILVGDNLTELPMNNDPGFAGAVDFWE